MQTHQRRNDARHDQTLMVNQPALRTSEGRIWIIVAGLFLLACAVPLSLLTVVDPRASAPAAWITAGVLVLLYAVLVAARGFIPDRERRLRLMTGLMLGMAATALFGMMVCAAIEWAAAPVL